MFREIRRVKNARPQEEGRELLRTCRRAALAVAGDDGYPYALPISFLYDEEEGRIYVHGSRRGHKMDALCACDKVCLTCWDEGELEEGDWAPYVKSVVVFGRASFVDDLGEVEARLRALAAKYYPPEAMGEAEDELRQALKAVQMIAIDIEHISCKRVHEK